MGHARCQEARTPVRVTREARWKATQVYLILGYKVMGRPRPERKSEPKAPTERRVLPMELQVGDRLTDETGDWEVIGRPYTTAGGKDARVRVQRVGTPGGIEIRIWHYER